MGSGDALFAAYQLNQKQLSEDSEKAEKMVRTERVKRKFYFHYIFSQCLVHTSKVFYGKLWQQPSV